MNCPNAGRPSPIVIRQATLSDATLLAELGARTFEDTYSHANTKEDMRQHLDAVFSVAARAADLSDVNRVTWIAETPLSDATPVGTAVGYAVVLRGSRADGVTFRAAAELEKIYVRQSSHRQGAGEALMNACVTQARHWQCDGLWLAVWEKNPRARAFYERMGFTVVGAKTFQLGNDVQHDLVMARAL